MSKPTYEELEAQVKQLAAENAKLADCANFYQLGFKPVKGAFGIEYRPTEQLLDDCGNTALEAIKTPATDAIIAALRAEGVEMAADELFALAERSKDEAPVAAEHAHAAALFIKLIAAQLRSQSAPSPEINDASDIEPFGFVRRSGDQIVIDVNGDPHIKDGMPVYTRQSEQVKGVQS